MCNPVDDNGYMAMIVYKNGALAREHIRDLYADKSWDVFSKYLKDSPAGNDGHIGFFFQEHEIIPAIKGYYYFDDKDQPVKAFDNPQRFVRGIVESQILSMYVHSKNIGLQVTHGVLVTGGTAKNKEILQIISDVFGVPVYTGKQDNSASLGAAFKALHGHASAAQGKPIPFSDLDDTLGPTAFKLSAQPNLIHHDLYKKLSIRYKNLEEKILHPKSNL